MHRWRRSKQVPFLSSLYVLSVPD